MSDTLVSDIGTHIESLRYPLPDIQRKTRAIHAATLRESRSIRAANFAGLSVEDVERLFRLYDSSFFGGLFQQLLSREGEAPLTFRVSKTMTSAGGKTTRVLKRGRSKGDPEAVLSYELAVSAPLLFQTFQADGRPIIVAGVECVDRLEALQRIVEHEMLHLLELLVWRHSSCARERFRRLAHNLFAHNASDHQLVTQREIAHREFGIKVGDRVAFEYQGARHLGTVNRVTKRVTVLVENPRGARHSDGKRYLKFYVPLPLLQRAEPAPPVAATIAASPIRLDSAGTAWIEGTATTVADVVRRKQASGLSPEALQGAMPHLTLAQIYAALAYYHAHPAALDAEIERQRRRTESPRAQEKEPPAREAGGARKRHRAGKQRRR
jgi:uncharacterized protein (DUF433 family)